MQVLPFSLFTEFDSELFKAGKHFKLYEKLGSHITTHQNIQGVYFAVWAPNASQVSVIGNFNEWQDHQHKLNPRWDNTGIWEGFIPNIGKGELYKYRIHSHHYGQILEKTDPFALFYENPPKSASIVWDTEYDWKDKKWLENRAEYNALDKAFSVYEVHLGSWKRKYEEGGRSLHYTEMAEELVQYVKEMGFTHVEMLPVMEHPFYGSWGYQVSGYFAPSARYGTPQEFMYLVDKFHEANIGVILDWVPSHFPTDAFALSNFDGTALYEHQDPRLGFHPDWGSYIFNYGRNEVRAFLISNALFWLDKYHADAIRVDAVASMLYLDYSRKEGEWIPNMYGGRENLEAISFLQEMNIAVYANFPTAQTIAEESTAFTGVSRPVFNGGLGFGQKWMMGWMHDTLKYFQNDPIYRQYHQNMLSFGLVYAFTENFMLPFSHDEVVHGKGPLIDRMPGDEWQRFANLRTMYGYMFMHPGNKLLFMGGEFGQTTEWNHDRQLDWHLLEKDYHKGIASLTKDLNHLFKNEKALHELPFSHEGFQWIDHQDAQNCVISFIRKGKNPQDQLIIVCNFTPIVRENYRIGVMQAKEYVEILSTDDTKYQGSGVKNKNIKAQKDYAHGFEYSITLNLPPLGVLVIRPNQIVIEEIKVAKNTKKSPLNPTGEKSPLTPKGGIDIEEAKAEKSTKEKPKTSRSRTKKVEEPKKEEPKTEEKSETTTKGRKKK
jgi:1,4-alpha-glucan branching enzyme